MSEKKTVSVNIISSCVCRDSFEIGKRVLMNHQYKIGLFYQAASPFSIYSKPDERLKKVTKDDFVYGTEWIKRILITDFRKDLFDSIEERRDSFLLLDFTDFARPLFRLTSDDSAYILKTELLGKNIEVINEYVKCSVFPWELSLEYIDECLDNFVNDLYKRYDPDKTILCKIQHVSKYVTKEGEIKSFTFSTDKMNEFIDYCNNYFIKAYERKGAQIHIIEMPKNVLASELHKWGNASRHYCDDYYEYLLSAIDCCMCQYDRETEKEMLDTLFTKCTTNFERIYAIADASKNAVIQQQTAAINKELSDKVTATINHINTLSREKVELNKKISSLNEEIKNIRASKSYKIGRFITFVPRKLRRKKK